MANRKPEEPSHLCPKCSHGPFTTRGLKTHNCAKRAANPEQYNVEERAKRGRMQVAAWAVKTDRQTAQPDAQSPEIPRAVKEITFADLDVLPPVRTLAVPVSDFFQAKTYLQGLQAMGQGAAVLAVLLGTELMRLHKLHGVKRGGNRRSADQTQNGLGLKWEDRVQAELGISDQSASNYMKLAEQARKRLPEFGPIAEELLSTPLSSLSDSRRMELAERTRNILPSNQVQHLSLDWGICKKERGGNNYDRAARGKGKTGLTSLPPGEQALNILAPAFEEFMRHWPQHWVHMPHHLLEEWDGHLGDMRKQLKKVLHG